ncbi:mycA [Symbiodinium pilosum]|uniref:MycA protein n=1 Tax=Symbiodinium pilosum TaxID=2952 RepID=A0A812T4A4_SYMPI|nr:mycA [Symbiodinium pilosum]
MNKIPKLSPQALPRYWVCCFSVNQHSTICGENLTGDKDPVTGLQHPTCFCNLPKTLNQTPPLDDTGKSISCELNKFDSMMSYLACRHELQQVIAIDASFCLFQRAWCIAELVEAHKNMIPQHLKVFSRSKLYGTEEQLRDLRVQDMKATRSEDVDEILCKIPDKDAFNQFLQHLIFDTGGLLDQWHRGDASQQMGGVGRLLKWSRSGFDIWPLWEY